MVRQRVGFLQPDVRHGSGHREAGLSDTVKAVTIHNLRHARAAVAAAAETNRPVILLSAPAAAGGGGPAWFRALADAAHRDHPDTQVTAILDCGSFAGYALAALRHGLTAIRYDGAAFSALAAIAAESGATLIRTRPEALDLASVSDDASRLQEACRRWFADGSRT